MELSNFADETSKDVISSEFKKRVILNGKRLTIELSSFCWAHDNKLSIDVKGPFGWGRFISSKSFKAAKLTDLDRLIRRIKKVKKCTEDRCKQSYLVHDLQKKKNPKGLCPRHLKKSVKDRQRLILRAQEENHRLIQGVEHDRVTSSGGVQDDESTQEAILIYSKSISSTLNKELKPEKLLRDVSRGNGSQIVLGIADYLIKRKVSFNIRGLKNILRHIEIELEPNNLSDWFDKKKRKKDLNALRKKIERLSNKVPGS